MQRMGTLLERGKANVTGLKRKLDAKEAEVETTRKALCDLVAQRGRPAL